MSEVAAIVNSPGRAGVSRKMRDAGAVGMSRAQGFLSSSLREEHLRVGPHQGDGDFAPPIELATDDGPGRLAVETPRKLTRHAQRATQRERCERGCGDRE
jgi:hypothetical protein